MALYKISSSRVNNIEANQYTGSVVEEGLIWYDPNDGLLRLYNGNVGGYIINSGGGGGGGRDNPIAIDYNGNVVTSNVRSINFTGNGVSVTNSGANVTVNIDQPPTNLIELGTSNVRVWPDGNVTISIRGNANAAVFSNPVAVFDNLIVTGLETAGILNANVISAAGNVTAANFIGNGAGLSNLSAANVIGAVANSIYSNTANTAVFANNSTTAGTVSNSAQPNITSVGTLTSLSVSGNVNTAGNIQATYFVGNGSQLTGLPPTYSNSNVATYLASGNNTSNIITAGNISGQYILGNASFMTGIPESYGNSNVASYLPTYTGGFTSLTGNITTTANVTAAYFIGDGSRLTGVIADVPGVFGLVIDGGNAAVSSDDFIIDGGGA